MQLQISVMGFTIYVCYQNDMDNFAAYCCSHYVVASIAMANCKQLVTKMVSNLNWVERQFFQRLYFLFHSMVAWHIGINCTINLKALCG